MEKGWKHKKSSNKNKFKVGDIVSYSDGVQKFEGKITGDFTDEKFYVGDKYGYQVSGFGDRLKPEQLTLVTKKMAKGGGVGKKVYNTMYGVGRSKYVVNYHDGVKTHKDGSEFFDIAIFKNKIEFNKFVNKLKKEGYVQGHEHGGKMEQGGGLKSSGNVYKLRAEGLNDFLAFLQQGMYFRVKSFTVETTSGPDVVVSFTTDASLSEIKSKLDEVPDSHVMLETIKPINQYTGERNEEYAKGGGVLTKGSTITFKSKKDAEKRLNLMKIEDGYKNLKIQKVTDGWSVTFDFENKMAKGGGIGSSSKLKYSLYLDRTVGDNVTTYHIADFAAKGDLSIALESLKEAAPKNYMYYTK